MAGTDRAAAPGAAGRLLAAGLRVTPQRAAMVAALAEAAGPVTARALWERVQARQPGIGLDTIYRNLAVFVQHGLLTQINLQNRESARFELEDLAGHHHHFICLECGRTFCVEACPVPAAPAPPQEDPGFHVSGHAFEVYGRCSGCQAQA